MLHNYYSILGISPGASIDEIKKAFRTKAKLYHPDVSNSPKSSELFILVNEAYEVLTDEQRRFVYDLKLKYPKQMTGKAHQDPRKYGTASQYGNIPREGKTYRRSAQPMRENPTSGPFMVTMMYAFGMFIGFTIVFVTLQSVYKHYWPNLFILLSIPGFLLIKEGWEGLSGKGSWIKMILKKAKTFF